MSNILIDMNNSSFQKQLFNLEKQEQRSLLNTLNKISKLNWQELYSDKGIRWELITSENPNQKAIYSFRFSKKYRGIAYRRGDYFILLNLFVDHDGAYK